MPVSCPPAPRFLQHGKKLVALAKQVAPERITTSKVPDP